MSERVPVCWQWPNAHSHSLTAYMDCVSKATKLFRDRWLFWLVDVAVIKYAVRTFCLPPVAVRVSAQTPSSYLSSQSLPPTSSGWCSPWNLQLIVDNLKLLISYKNTPALQLAALFAASWNLFQQKGIRVYSSFRSRFSLTTDTSGNLLEVCVSSNTASIRAAEIPVHTNHWQE